MPYSSNALDDVAERTLRLIPVGTHLDIGAGAGKYGMMLARLHPQARRTAVEAWRPYIDQFHLQSVYQDIRVMAAQDLIAEPDAAWDVVTLGDVLEHLPKTDGISLLEYLIYRSKAIWVQVPLHYLQGTTLGNPLEAHVSIWQPSDFARYESVTTVRGDMLGVWLWGWRSDYSDWYAWAHGLQWGLQPSIAPERALELAGQYGLNTFVETGIWHGGTTAWAARHFARVWACDLDLRWVEHARARLKHAPHVTIVDGDSRPFLLNLLNALREPALLYLDAHYIADKKSAGDAADCPLLGELAAIRVSGVKHVVVVDDARLITGRDPEYLSWPTLDQVQAALPGWTFTLEGRALVGVPDA